MKLVMGFLAASALIISSAIAADDHKINEPEMDSHLGRTRAQASVPISKSYEQMTDDEKAVIRSDYQDLPAGDEPPYPLHGQKPIYDALSKMQRVFEGDGMLSLAVRVDETGKGRAIQFFEIPDERMAQPLAGLLLRDTRYKPGKCAGKPCVMDFPLKIQLSIRHPFPAG